MRREWNGGKLSASLFGLDTLHELSKIVPFEKEDMKNLAGLRMTENLSQASDLFPLGATWQISLKGLK
jgi:hypothetical protein